MKVSDWFILVRLPIIMSQSVRDLVKWNYRVVRMANLHFLLLFSLTSVSFCYKPVIIVHGILDHASDMEDLASFITQAHPGTNITLVKLFQELESFTPLWRQVSAITATIRPVMQNAKDGVHIIGFSQGIVPQAFNNRLLLLPNSLFNV